jgi:hypothetical protein
MEDRIWLIRACRLMTRACRLAFINMIVAACYRHAFITYMHTYIHTYIHAYIHTCIHTCIHAYT